MNTIDIIPALSLLILLVIYLKVKKRRSSTPHELPGGNEEIKREILEILSRSSGIDQDDEGIFVYNEDEIQINRGLFLNERIRWSDITCIMAYIPNLEFYNDKLCVQIQLNNSEKIFVNEEEAGFYQFLQKIKSRFPESDISFIDNDRDSIKHQQFQVYPPKH